MIKISTRLPLLISSSVVFPPIITLKMKQCLVHGFAKNMLHGQDFHCILCTIYLLVCFLSVMFGQCHFHSHLAILQMYHFIIPSLSFRKIFSRQLRNRNHIVMTRSLIFEQIFQSFCRREITQMVLKTAFNHHMRNSIVSPVLI